MEVQPDTTNYIDTWDAIITSCQKFQKRGHHYDSACTAVATIGVRYYRRNEMTRLPAHLQLELSFIKILVMYKYGNAGRSIFDAMRALSGLNILPV